MGGNSGACASGRGNSRQLGAAPTGRDGKVVCWSPSKIVRSGTYPAVIVGPEQTLTVGGRNTLDGRWPRR